jgi:hypothetical protein
MGPDAEIGSSGSIRCQVNLRRGASESGTSDSLPGSHYQTQLDRKDAGESEVIYFIVFLIILGIKFQSCAWLCRSSPADQDFACLTRGALH